jgi:hypothetical protein
MTEGTIETLPAVLDRTRRNLEEAATVAEILEAREDALATFDQARHLARLARIKGAGDELMAKVLRLQADALELEARAAMRIAEEYQNAQRAGLLAQHGGDRKSEEFKSSDSSSALDFVPELNRNIVNQGKQLLAATAAKPEWMRESLDHMIEHHDVAKNRFGLMPAALPQERAAAIGAGSGHDEIISVVAIQARIAARMMRFIASAPVPLQMGENRMKVQLSFRSSPMRQS